MSLFRRFLVIQALLFWQGGFLFYAAVVIPVGSAVLGSWAQGTVTRHVTHWMNLIGAVALVILAWDQWADTSERSRRLRWGLWAVMGAGLVALAVLHPTLAAYVDGAAENGTSYADFYLTHRVYLYIASIQWVASLGYVVAMLRAWSAKAVCNGA
jgi:hypothetical protein